MHPTHGRPPQRVDAQAQGPGSGAELFVVEGESAAGAVAAVRDARTQAVLPMQGKPMNTWRATPARVRTQPWFMALIDAIGAGWGPEFKLQACRYDRVLLLMDPDADGIHSGALLLLFFQRWMPELLSAGRLWRVRAPLGEIRCGPDAPVQFAYTQPQFLERAAQARARTDGAGHVLRYRGLGGLDGEHLRRTCLDPATRVSHVLGPEEARQAAEFFGGEGGPAWPAGAQAGRKPSIDR